MWPGVWPGVGTIRTSPALVSGRLDGNGPNGSPLKSTSVGENQSGQRVTLQGTTLTVGAEVHLIDETAAAAAGGQAPTALRHCAGGKKKFKDLDGEAVEVSVHFAARIPVRPLGLGSVSKYV